MAEANRGTTWADKEVKALLSIWGDSKIQEELDGAVRNKVVYVRIAKKLLEQGYQREWKQCRAKVKNLKTKYREVKDNNDKTGRERKSCRFYRELDEILGHRPASVPPALLDTGDTHSESEAENEEDDVDDGTQVQAHSPLDSAVISEGTEVKGDGDDDGKPVDETAPPSKKQKREQKREKKSKVEKAFENAMTSFAKFQAEADEKFEKREEERWKKEMEMEERRRKEDQQHEMHMMQMLGQLLQRRPYPPPTSSPYDLDYHDNTF